MPLRLYNTLSQKLEKFEPRPGQPIRVYLCGLTTYDLAHAGHARTNTVFDVLVRHLRSSGLDVRYVRNITDVDDKILRRAGELGERPLDLSARMADIAAEDLGAIGCGKPDEEPRVSESIESIVSLVRTLVDNGSAYAVDTGRGKDVYFRVRRFADYGKLSHRDIDALMSGARVEVGEVKEDPLDFALWKGDESESALGWDSPWGKGRPGWHIECSAMAHEALGPHLDIHGGGMDLIFPHHENEIAQSEAAWGAPFSRLWVHSGFLTVDSEKMSKSLGNFVTIRDVLARNDAEAFRYFLLGTHYRGPLALDVDKRPNGRVVFPGIDEAEKRVDYLYITLKVLDECGKGENGDGDQSVGGQGLGGQELGGHGLDGHVTRIEKAKADVVVALDKDLNTSVALAAIGELAKTANEVAMKARKLAGDAKAAPLRRLAAESARALREAAAPLGLLSTPVDTFFRRTLELRLSLAGLEREKVDTLVCERDDARARKDFARADELRKELTSLKVELLDSPTRTTWRVLP